MTTREWLAFITRLAPLPQTEMTNLVTFVAENSGIFESRGEAASIEIALDWWIHVGGTLRRQGEEKLLLRLATAGEVNLCFHMEPDPVSVFEVESWLGKFLMPALRARIDQPPIRVTLSTRKEQRPAWTSSISFLRQLPWTEIEIQNDVLLAGRALGAFSTLDRETYEAFLLAMREAGVDPGEPPWIFWSRLPGWLHYRQARENVVVRDRETLFQFETKLIFQKCALSPQDEIGEALSLGADTLMVNPTFETLLQPESRAAARDTPIEAFCRRDEIVMHRSITALEAMVLDQVRESFRAERPIVAQEISRESGVRKEFVLSTITILVTDGFLLAGAHFAGESTASH